MNYTALLAALALCWAHATTAEAATRRVAPGEDLQAALDAARPGDTIELTPGAVYEGSFVLPRFEGLGWVTLRTAATPGQPAAGERVTASHAPLLATLRPRGREPVIRTARNAHHWRLRLLHFSPGPVASGDLVRLGDGGGGDVSARATHLIVERCLFLVPDDRQQKRGIALNSAATIIRDSSLLGFKVRGQDSQAIAGWNGPGPYLIENNHLEAASENLLFGGADPSTPDLVPSNITIRRNLMTKPLEWRKSNWGVKNVFELKNARRVLVEGNIIEHCWEAGQTGFAVVLKSENQGGRAPWTVVEDVTFRYNIIRKAGGAFNIRGLDDQYESKPAGRIRIEHNLITGIDHREWGGKGAFLQVGEGVETLIVDHNTIFHTGMLIEAYGAPTSGLKFTNNVARHNQYGVKGSSTAVGSQTLERFFPGAEFSRNVLAGGRASQYPPDNLFPAVEEFERQFVDRGAGDLRLVSASMLRSRATDGSDLGADVAKVMAAIGGTLKTAANADPAATLARLGANDGESEHF